MLNFQRLIYLSVYGVSEYVIKNYGYYGSSGVDSSFYFDYNTLLNPELILKVHFGRGGTTAQTKGLVSFV